MANQIHTHSHGEIKMYGEIKLYAGSGSPELAQKIADYLQQKLSPREVIQFPNENIFIKLNSSARGHRSWMACIEWETSTIVVPAALSSRIRSKHLSWKATSPTASTSSIRSTSGSTWMATEKPSRMNIPEE